MPLVVITGYPSSGKSTFAKSLQKYLQEKTKGVVALLAEDDIIQKSNLDKNQVFSNSRLEASIRDSLKSQILSNLSRDSIVIVDALNYIKGFRYELFCGSKSLKTNQVTIHCDVQSSDCWLMNTSKNIESNKISQDVFTGLVNRYEAPNSRDRWDSPLFVILKDREPSFDGIYEALCCRKAPKPNHSTQNQPLSSPDFVYELDRITSSINSFILTSFRNGLQGQELSVPNTNERLNLSRNVNLAELTRSKHQFISYVKTRGLNDIKKIPSMYVASLNTSLFSNE